jgi:serine/threonine protein kinase
MTDAASRLNAALEGRYRIERELGAGGMATVYLAEDLRHQRQVAIKVLKPELAAVVGAERFLAEIRTTANLQHPNILPLFDSGEADGFLFYVMPYVEGETLADRLARSGELPVREAVRVASAVALALGYAHRQGVVHRDIKPANILLQDGQPVVADFGIALAVSAAGGGRLTETGLSLGTPHYMSPEQATGDRPPGPAADIYSLGCILFEMLVGEPPFTGPSAQAVLGKALTAATPLPTQHRASVPGHVEAVILKALEKLPADRFEKAEDLAGALEDEAFRHGIAPAEEASSAGGPWRTVAVAATAIAVIFGFLLARSALTPEPPGIPHRFSINLDHPLSEGISLSADGGKLAYRDMEGAVWVRSLTGLEETRVTDRETRGRPVLSPDGSEVAVFFEVPGDLDVFPLDGTPPRTILPGGWAGGRGMSATWLPSGDLVLAQYLSVDRVPPEGGDTLTVRVLDRSLEEAFISLAPLPDGEHILAQQGENAPVIGRMRLSDGLFEPIVAGRAPSYANGYLFFQSAEGGILHAAPFDPSGAELEGDPVVLAEGVYPGIAEEYSYAVSDSGLLVYQVRGPTGSGEIVRIERSGQTSVVPLDHSLTGRPDVVAISPDGVRVAYTGSGAVWVQDLDGGPAQRLGRSDLRGIVPRWHPNGEDVYFLVPSDAEPTSGDLYRQPADLSRPAELVLDTERGIFDFVLHPDGHRAILVFEELEDVGDLAIVDLSGPEPPTPLAGSPTSDDHSPSVSPDGSWVAFQTDETGQQEVFVLDLDQDGRTIQVSVDGGHSPHWSPDGRELFYIDLDQQMWSVSVSTLQGFRALSRTPLFDVRRYAGRLTWDYFTAYAVEPDGETFLFADPGFSESGEMFVITDVFGELSRMSAASGAR